jgi:hypothetical protein
MKFRMHRHFIKIFIFIICCSSAIGAVDFESVKTPNWEQLTLTYSKDEIDYLRMLPKQDHLITSEELSQLTRELAYFIDSSNLSDINLTILPAYIANAQKDFAWLSYLTTGKLTGNLAPVTLWTLQLFVPGASLPSVREENFDLFSSLLSAHIVSKYAKRLDEERRGIKDYSIKKENGHWKPTSPGYVGLDNGSAKTWFLTSSKEFVAETPKNDPDFWEKQIEVVTDEQRNLDGAKVQKVFEWCGLTSVHAGSFEHYLYHYLEKKQFSVLDQLTIRALYLSAIADSNAAAFNSKYTFWVMRPSQRSNNIKPLIVIPNHPSYPSAHSTISATASTVMSELFPEDSDEWNLMAEESGMSRIWGGVHYPADHLKGQDLGRKVGRVALERGYQKVGSGVSTQ